MCEKAGTLVWLCVWPAARRLAGGRSGLSLLWKQDRLPFEGLPPTTLITHVPLERHLCWGGLGGGEAGPRWLQVHKPR